jgi:Tfp pilus assembly protein PilF
LKKYLKAAMHITKAINLNPKCYDYFIFRAQIYEVMGFIELSNDDVNYAKNLRNV